MYHYVFTNDLRVSKLDESLKNAGHCFVTDTIPSASENKSANNNINTLGFYFALTKTSNCAKAANVGDTRSVVLNFIKKFQYPNMRTKDAYNSSKVDGIQLVPLRIVVKLLYMMNLLYGSSVSYLTQEEIKNFIFYNDNVAKKRKPDIGQLIEEILQYRKSGILPSSISTSEDDHEWKHEDRQIRDMLSILKWSGCIVEENKKFLISNEELTKQNKADIFDIINCNSFWDGTTIESYYDYMDIEKYENEEDCGKTKEIVMELLFSTNIKQEDKRNRIIFGAPGTGKSYTLNKEKGELLDKCKNNFERVTFHPEYSYANFVGTYKPVMTTTEYNVSENSEKILKVLTDKSKTAQEKYDLLYDEFKGNGLTRLPLLLGLYTDESFKTKKQDGSDASGDNSVERNHGRAIRPYVNLYTGTRKTEEISYEYVPGPFMRVLAKALKIGMTDSPEPYLLIIEEINRANVAAVFGDVFQLLDRDSNNVREYEISTSKDMRMYLAKELGVDESEVETIKIPDNMFIWATMNSADQGVFPMDTAFKRRWDFTYLGIDDAEDTMEASIKDKKYTFGMGDDARLVSWNDIRKAINNELSNETYRINEDKLLGPYFISNSILLNASNDEFLKVFKNKVLMYLFEDAVKQRRSHFFDNCKDGNKGIRYSEICKAFDTKGVFIFPESISKEFIERPSDDESKDTDE